MTIQQLEKNPVYVVLVNEEEQYSIWPDCKQVPNGWRAVTRGDMEECCAYVDATWTDMRPLSLRKQMAASGAQGKQPS